MTAPKMNVVAGALALISLACACHPSQRGTQPHDMSAKQHETHARAEDRIAREHTQLASAASETSCSSSSLFDVCWTSPTSEQHAAMADDHHALAVRHRNAGTALLDAEARACTGIGEADRVTSPFRHLGDIDPTATEALERGVPHVDGQESMVPSGARVVFRAVPGMTAEWLQRLVECHLARNAAIGHDEASRAMPSCPLTLAGVHARVTSVGNGFAVDMTSADGDERTAKEIIRRARALGTGTK